MATATGDRTANFGSFDLTFNAVDIFNVNTTNGVNIDASAGSITISADGAGETVGLLHSTGLTNITVGETNISMNPSSTGAFIMGSNVDPDTNISVPIDGMLIEDSTDNDIRAYTGGTWVSLLDTFNMADADQTLTDNRLHDTSTFNFTLSGQGDISLISTDGATDSARLLVTNNDVTMRSTDGTNQGDIVIRDTGVIEVTGDGHFVLLPHTATTNGSGTQLRFQEANTTNGTNYVGFQAPDSIATSVAWVLPDADGTANQVLETDGSGTLSWTDQSGGGTLDYAHASDLIFNLSNILQVITNVTGNDWDTTLLGTAHKIQLGGLRVNYTSGAGIDTVNDEIDINTTGSYKIIVDVTYSNSASGIKYYQLVQNGTTILHASASGEVNVTQDSLVWRGDLTSGDTIDVRCNSAAASGNTYLYGFAIDVEQKS